MIIQMFVCVVLYSFIDSVLEEGQRRGGLHFDGLLFVVFFYDCTQ